jgi:hypothetical protein
LLLLIIRLSGTGLIHISLSDLLWIHTLASLVLSMGHMRASWWLRASIR